MLLWVDGMCAVSAWEVSDLKLFLFDLLLLRQSNSLLHGEFCRNSHQSVVDIDYVNSEMVQLEVNNKRIRIRCISH